MRRRTAFTLLILFFLLMLSSLGGYLFLKNRTVPAPTDDGVTAVFPTDSPSPEYSPTETATPEDGQPENALPDNTPLKNTLPEEPANHPVPSPAVSADSSVSADSAVPAVPDPVCFTYEELADGTLRITGYDEEQNTQNPYRVIIPSAIDGKPVSTLGTQSIAAREMVELIVSDGITTLDNNIMSSGWGRCLVALPDSALHIDPKAFNASEQDYVKPVIISCDSENSYAYQYAMENELPCRLENPVSEENAFLQDHAAGPYTSRPYLAHSWERGDGCDYVVIEYLDIAEGLQQGKASDRFSSDSIWQFNEFAVLVLDKESGSVLQCIDYSSFDPEMISSYDIPHVRSDNFLSIGDYNFDGHPDLCLYLGMQGNAAVTYDAVFLFDENTRLYENSFYMRNMVLNPEKQCIDSYERYSAGEHTVERYQYIDGALTCVARLSEYDIWEGDTRGVGVLDERLIGGEWQTYWYGELYLEDDFSAEAYEEAYKQLKDLYADDGYWD